MAVLFEPAMDPSRAYYGTDTRASRPAARRGAGPGVEADARAGGRDGEVKTVALDLAGMAGVGVLIACFAMIRETDTFLYRGGFAVVSVASCVAIAATVHPGTVLGPTCSAAAAADVDRQAVVLAVPVALADLRVHPAGDRPAARRCTRRSCCASS